MAPPPRVHTPEKTTEAAPDPLPRVVPGDTVPVPPASHQAAAETHEIPTHHRYNTRARRLQVQDLMVNHVATINTPPSKPINIAHLVRTAGDDWVLIGQVTGNLKLQPGRDNAFICPKTGKSQNIDTSSRPMKNSNG